MSLNLICGWLGLSRQAWYQQQKRQVGRSGEKAAIMAQVRRLRKNHPRMGVRSCGIACKAGWPNRVSK